MDLESVQSRKTPTFIFTNDMDKKERENEVKLVIDKMALLVKQRYNRIKDNLPGYDAHSEW